MTANTKLLSRNETAEYLGISTVSLDRFVLTGEIEPLYLGRRVMFEPYAVKEFIKTQRERTRETLCHG